MNSVQKGTRDSLIEFLKFIADDPETVGEVRTKAMVKMSVFAMLRAAFGNNFLYDKYRSTAVKVLKETFAEVPECPLKFTDIEIERIVMQFQQMNIMEKAFRDDLERQGRDIVFSDSAHREIMDYSDSLTSKATGMITPETDEASPTSNIVELQKYIKSWADFPAFGFGIPMLDNAIGGIYPGEVCVLTGAPGTMKTSLALCAVDDFVTRVNDGLVYYFSVDMEPYEMSMRLIERETDTPEQLVRSIAASDSDAFAELQAAVSTKYDNRFVMIGNEPGKPRITWGDVERECLLRQPQLVVIDYFTCLKVPMQSDLNFVEAIMPQVVDFAHRCQTCFILLSQMSRSSRAEQASGRMGGHGKGGGIVEERAHTEIELMHAMNPDEGAPLVIAGVSKARHGQSGQYFALDYNGPTKKFLGTAMRMAKDKRAARTVFVPADIERGFYDV